MIKIIKDMVSFEESKLRYHNKYLTNIPDDIDPKTDKKLWDIVYNLNVIYIDLVTEYFMDEGDVYLYVIDWCDFFSDLKEFTEPHKLMLLSIYLNIQYESICEWCLEMEYYEGLTNLKRFNDLI